MDPNINYKLDADGEPLLDSDGEPIIDSTGVQASASQPQPTQSIGDQVISGIKTGITNMSPNTMYNNVRGVLAHIPAAFIAGTNAAYSPTQEEARSKFDESYNEQMANANVPGTLTNVLSDPAMIAGIIAPELVGAKKIGTIGKIVYDIATQGGLGALGNYENQALNGEVDSKQVKVAGVTSGLFGGIASGLGRYLEAGMARGAAHTKASQAKAMDDVLLKSKLTQKFDFTKPSDELLVDMPRENQLAAIKDHMAKKSNGLLLPEDISNVDAANYLNGMKGIESYPKDTKFINPLPAGLAPHAIGGTIGASTGYSSSPDNRLTGALIGGLIGGLLPKGYKAAVDNANVVLPIANKATGIGAGLGTNVTSTLPFLIK